jgi:hypothetical protein
MPDIEANELLTPSALDRVAEIAATILNDGDRRAERAACAFIGVASAMSNFLTMTERAGVARAMRNAADRLDATIH